MEINKIILVPSSFMIYFPVYVIKEVFLLYKGLYPIIIIYLIQYNLSWPFVQVLEILDNILFKEGGMRIVLMMVSSNIPRHCTRNKCWTGRSPNCTKRLVKNHKPAEFVKGGRNTGWG